MARVLFLTATISLLLTAQPTMASSQGNTYPQLAGLKAVSVFVISHLPGLDSDALTRQISESLAKGGFRLESRDKAPQFVVRIESSPLGTALCPDMVSVQVTVYLEENVRVARKPGLADVRGATWHTEGFPTILSNVEAPDFATRESLVMAESFADNVAYSTSASAKAKVQRP